MKKLLLTVTFIIMITGCVNTSVSKKENNLDAAIVHVKNTYPGIVVTKIDGHTISVIWESEADEKFKELKKKIKKDFGVDTFISAIE